MSASTALFPTSPHDTLARLYVGKSIRDVPTPAAVINVAAVRRNCERMLQACKNLGLGWRAHVKTHKTWEVTRLQVGEDDSAPVHLVVSTLVEAEFLLPLLRGYRDRGRRVNVLYGLPLSHNAVSRLAVIGQALGTDSIAILLDDPAQLPIVSRLRKAAGILPHAYIKIDMGGRRSGVIEDSPRFLEVVGPALFAHEQGDLIFSGLYSHAGHSYGGDSRVAALRMMHAEVAALLTCANRVNALAVQKGLKDVPRLVLSAGASPTALSVQNLLKASDLEIENAATELRAEVTSLTSLFATVTNRGHSVEIHAGVYPLLDLQQLAAHSLSASRLSWRDIALTILAEVHSIYPHRGVNGTTEAMVGAGCLALGREPCKAYDGMAMLTPWQRKGADIPQGDVEGFEGWIIGRFSQEHGILTWRSIRGSMPPPSSDQVEVGQKVRLWPNHACITSNNYGWYFVVDEDRAGEEDQIVDIWIRARGW